MKATRSQWVPGWLGTLLAISLATTAAGCGLKGDLYLEKPDTDKPPAAAAETGGDTANGQPTEAADRSDEPGAPEAAAGDGMTAEAPDETSELVNTEAAMDAAPESSVIVPGNINDPEGPGDTAAEQLSSEAALATDPDSAEIEPVNQSELKDPDAETAEDSPDTIAKPAEPKAAPTEGEAEAGSLVAPPVKETSDAAVPAQ